MHRRIAQIRNEVNLKQDEFAEKIGLTKNFISLIETGKRTPSDRTIKDICREFDVNEEWIRTGEGEMFIDNTREMELARLTKKLLADQDEAYTSRLISALVKLNTDQWELLAKISEEMLKE